MKGAGKLKGSENLHRRCCRLLLRRLGAVSALLLLLGGCSPAPQTALPGTLEWDRVAILAEASEPVVELVVAEGESVRTGQLLLRLDPRRTDAELAGAEAQVQRQRALLQELRHGARVETIDAARAELARAKSDAETAARESERAASLVDKGLISRTEAERRANSAQMALAQAEATEAKLVELLHGTRPEQLEQAQAALAGAEAQARLLRLTRQRLDVTAPRAGRVDALPFRLGDQPVTGAALVSLLVGEAPYARVYVPEGRRAGVAPGQRFRVKVDGVDTPFDAVLRSVRSEPTFTPYYGLTGDDASRLSYRAELVLQSEAARELPAGLPCTAEAIGHE